MATAEHVLVVADGDVDRVALLGLVERPGAAGRPLVIAADGGAGQVLDAGLVPDLVLGDFDSLDPAGRARLESLGAELRAAERDKDESDMELCLLAALEAGAARVTILGALGLERPEHSIANLLLLADPRLDGTEVEFVGRGARITRIGRADAAGEADVDGNAGDFVSLFPLDPAVHGVTTRGLRFPLNDETLHMGPSRGLSNELTGRHARVTTRLGRLLVVHTGGSR